MNKVFTSFEEAVQDIQNGSTLVVGGFVRGIPEKAIQALRRQDVKELTVVSNNCGVDDWVLVYCWRIAKSKKWSLLMSGRINCLNNNI